MVIEAGAQEKKQKIATQGSEGGYETIDDVLNRPHKQLITRLHENDIADFPEGSGVD